MFYAIAFVDWLTTGDFKGPFRSVAEAEANVANDLPDIGEHSGYWIVERDLWKEMGGESGYVDDSMELDSDYVAGVVPAGMTHETGDKKDGE